MTTHYMDEAEELTDTVGIINQGKLVAEGTPQALIEEMGADTIHWMKIGALINPTTYTIDGVRQMMFTDPVALAGGNPLPLWLCWLVVAALGALGMWMATATFKKSIK